MHLAPLLSVPFVDITYLLTSWSHIKVDTAKFLFTVLGLLFFAHGAQMEVYNNYISLMVVSIFVELMSVYIGN